MVGIIIFLPLHSLRKRYMVPMMNALQGEVLRHTKV